MASQRSPEFGGSKRKMRKLKAEIFQEGICRGEGVNEGSFLGIEVIE